MVEQYGGAERREFLRYRYEKPVHYNIVDSLKTRGRKSKLVNAVSKNLSASGILFTTKQMPKLSSILIIDLDYRTSQICQEIEENALIVNNRLLGKVVRIEEADGNLYDAGVAFVKKSETLPEELKNLLR